MLLLPSWLEFSLAAWVSDRAVGCDVMVTTSFDVGGVVSNDVACVVKVSSSSASSLASLVDLVASADLDALNQDFKTFLPITTTDQI